MVGVSTTDTNADGGGKVIDRAQDAVFAVEDVRVLEQDGKIEVDLCIVASTEESQIDRATIKSDGKNGESFYLSAASRDRLFTFACALGIYSRERWRADAEAGRDVDLPFENITGMLFAAKVEMKPYDGDKAKYQGKSFADIGQFRNFWAIGDLEAKHIPLPNAIKAMYPNGLPTSEGIIAVASDATTAPATAAPVAAEPAQAATQQAATEPVTADDLFG